MMSAVEKLQAVQTSEIVFGMPLAFSLYDKVGRLLLPPGEVVESAQQLESLADNGLFRESAEFNAAMRTAATSAGSVASKHKPVEKVEDLLSIKLVIGDTVQLQDFSYEKQRYFVKLIGFVNRKSVLVSHPRQDDKLSYIKEGASFLVRGFAGTKTYEFSSNVISVCLKPYPYLHLAYPAEVKTTNMRSAVRIKLRLVCKIDSSVTGDKVTAIIEDMSISGARIHASKAFGEVGDKVAVGLRMQVTGEAQVFVVSAVIRNVRAETDSQTGKKIVMHGMEFVQSVSVDLTLLQNFLYKSMLES